MNIALVTPAAAGSRHGNRNTAARWARLLRALGHRVTVRLAWKGEPAGALIALHARRSHDSIARFARARPDAPLIVLLTGTDLYRDLKTSTAARRSLQLATRLVVLQDRGLSELPAAVRSKAVVIHQSVRPVRRPRPLGGCFEVVVSGHLRSEKDPFRCAAALRYLPESSRIVVTHIGGAREPALARAATAWMRREPRYRWHGSRPPARALGILARARALVISSIMEGGANVVGEALAHGVPVIASRIPGNVGMLGADYAGYFPVGNERALARLLRRIETETEFRDLLRSQCQARRHLVTPARERAALRRLIAGLGQRSKRSPQRG